MVLERRRQLRLIMREFSTPLEPDGFREVGPLVLARERGLLRDVIRVSFANARRDRICVQYGVTFPTLIQEVVAALLPDKNAKGEWVSEPLKDQRTYVCFTEDQIREYIPKAVSDLREEAFSWMAKFQKPKDVVNAWHLRNISSEEPSSKVIAGGPTRWAIYGFMLLDLGERDNARRWLIRAGDELAKPVFTDGVRFETWPFPGCKKLGPSPEETCLLGLVRKALVNQ